MNKFKKMVLGFCLLHLCISTEVNGQTKLNFDSLVFAQKEVNMDSVIAVPNKEVAISIAKAIWMPIYGKEIKRQKPYVAYLNKEDIWVVQGTFNRRGFGGVAYAFIRRKDAKLIYVIHTR